MSEPTREELDPAQELTMKIMEIWRDTPEKDTSYMCHGEPHYDRSPDYNTIGSAIEKLLGDEHHALTERVKELESVIKGLLKHSYEAHVMITEIEPHEMTEYDITVKPYWDKADAALATGGTE